MPHETSIHMATAGKRLPLPGLNPSSYTYFDSSSESEISPLGEDTDLEVTIPESSLDRFRQSGKGLPCNGRRISPSMSPFSSELEESELEIPGKHSGKSLKNILSLREKINFHENVKEETEEETEEEGFDENFGIKYEHFSKILPLSPSELYEEELQEISTYSHVTTLLSENKGPQEVQLLADGSEVVPSVNSIFDLPSDHLSSNGSPSPSPLSSYISLSPALHIFDKISHESSSGSISPHLQLLNDTIMHEIDCPFTKEDILNESFENEDILGEILSNMSDEEFTSDVDMINSSVEQVVEESSDSEEIEWHVNTSKVDSFPGESLRRDRMGKRCKQRSRFDPYGLKQATQNGKPKYIRGKGRGGRDR
ncbi:hypothetical protein K7432_006295 [Basidiobolus ranarum]|uniref:Uncharacterized protein n=1 Tax=Basidiobolus ranarum TaxID=34480 RepID=A0ABR2W1V5_9FUNG